MQKSAQTISASTNFYKMSTIMELHTDQEIEHYQHPRSLSCPLLIITHPKAIAILTPIHHRLVLHIFKIYV